MVAESRVRMAHKPRMLVVDDEPDNLDLLYRTFRRDFNVLRAESGQRALEILSDQGEVAVIISDQRMPEMKGTEFLSKTVPEFPDTVRIILTGFTDVEDLVDAINAGQVYRYITKPWDPDELRHVVDQAASTYDLLKQRGEAIDLSQNQHRLVMAMAEIAQSNDDVAIALPAIAAAIQSVVQAQGCGVHLVERGALGNHVGLAGQASSDFLKQSPLVAEAIATGELKSCEDVTKLADADAKALCESSQVAAQCVAPVLFRQEVIAIVSLQWDSPQTFSDSNQNFFRMTAQQVALTLACI
ncbi:MAG TPA: response regulator [Candidatus Obscuribacterales bacterium]